MALYTFSPDLGGLLSLVLVVALPLVVGLVTRSSTSSGVKAVLLLALAAVTTFVQAWLNVANAGGVFEWIPVVYNIAVNFGIAVAVHFGLWRPTGAADVAQDSLVKD